ncbi:ATP-binding protein [Streptomyces sp. NPDC088197]|uniref:ATP-binding protein n=1 Tax=unclassified Streptomyces TaxID=2593676 RepID=UPI0033AD0468
MHREPPGQSDESAGEPPGAESRTVARLWPRTPRSVGRARHELETALKGWGLEDLTDSAVLILSELFTNAVVHARVAGRDVQTRYVRTPGGVRIEVHDAGDGRPEPRVAAESDEDGRGLALVNAVAGPGHWGVGERDGVGKMVWAECGLGR